MKKSGFTLIELLVVIAIIVVLGMVVVNGYLGLARTIASQQAERQVRKALTLARQHACLDGRPTYFYILNNRQYILCTRMGVASSKSKPEGGDVYSFDDYYSALVEINRDIQIYNLSRPEISQAITCKAIISRGKDRVGWTIKHTGGTEAIQQKDIYGVGLYPVQSLPTGYEFGGVSKAGFIFFNADGSLGQQSLSSLEVYNRIAIKDLITGATAAIIGIEGTGLLQ